jgi:anti-sigma B factor antagonist
MTTPTVHTQARVEKGGNVTIITFTADPVRDVEDVLARELGGLTDGLAGCHLLLDFTNVDYLNSTELGTLITLHKRVETVGGRLTLFNLSTQVLSLFTISRLDTYLTVCKRADGAANDPEPLQGEPAAEGT